MSVWRELHREEQFASQISAAAGRYAVDPLLVRAVIWRESRFYPQRRGTRHELGLMQLQDASAQEWADAEGVRPFAHEHCLDPGTNIMAGVFFISAN